MKKIIYILTIEYNPEDDEIEFIKEEVIDDIKPIRFIGNMNVLDSLDEKSLSMITCYEIGEC